MKVLICFLLVLTSVQVFSQEPDSISGQVNKEMLPIPREKNQLFYLQRDPDSNTIVYALNFKNGELNPSSPIQAYWIRYADQGQIEKLTFIQRKLAYGVHHKEIKPGVYEVYVQAHKPLKIILSKDATNGKHEASVKVKDKTIVLKRIFVRINGGSLFKPNVQYIEIFGRDKKNEEEISYRFDI